MKNLKHFDFYGGNCNLYFKHYPGPRTIFGGCITILLLILLILAFIGFGKNFYLRENPSSIIQYINLDQYTVQNITNKKLPIAFRIEDINNNLFDTEGKLFYFNVYQQIYKQINGSMQHIDQININYRLCTKDDFINEGIFLKYGFRNTYCIDHSEFNLKFGGYWDGTEVYPLYFDVMKCQEGTVNNKNVNCSSEIENYSAIQSGVWASFFIPDYLMNPANYTSPLSLQFTNYYFQIDGALQKSYLMKLQTIEVQSDYGWILENPEVISALSLQSYATEINLISSFNSHSTSNFLGNFSFYGSRKVLKYIRAYEKIQYLAAEIGGLLKALTVILAFIIQFYNKLFLNYRLVETLWNHNRKVESDSLITKNFSQSPNKLTKQKKNDRGKNDKTTEKKLFNILDKLDGVRKNNFVVSKKTINVITTQDKIIKEKTFEDTTFKNYVLSHLLNIVLCFKKAPKFRDEDKEIREKLDIKNVLTVMVKFDWLMNILFDEQESNKLFKKNI